MPVELIQSGLFESVARSRPSDRRSRAFSGTIVFHPRYEHFLERCGVLTARDALSLPGEIVCGHPDRHVVRTELRCDTVVRTIFVKREHRVALRTRFRNSLSGFGWVSRSEREAMTLQALEAAGLPGPQWLAHGEDDNGRAFLMVDDLEGWKDLLTLLKSHTSDGRFLAERIGRSIAELHAAGFATPELSSKHVFIQPVSRTVALIDWQSAPRQHQVKLSERVRSLAGLNASLHQRLVNETERLQFVRSYWIAWRRSLPNLDSRARFPAFVKAVKAETERISARSSKRDQQLRPAPTLQWLAGESVCVTSDLGNSLPDPVDGPPFYIDDAMGHMSSEEWITLPDGRLAFLMRFRRRDLVGRLVAALRERPWRSPGAVGARILFHLYRHEIAAPQLLAFGQRIVSSTLGDSFILYSTASSSIPLRERLAQPHGNLSDTRHLLKDCGATLRAIHDSGCRPNFGMRPLFVVSDCSGTICLDSPYAVRIVRWISGTNRIRDLKRLFRHELPNLRRSDRMRVAKGYYEQGENRDVESRSVFATFRN